MHVRCWQSRACVHLICVGLIWTDINWYNNQSNLFECQEHNYIESGCCISLQEFYQGIFEDSLENIHLDLVCSYSSIPFFNKSFCTSLPDTVVGFLNIFLQPIVLLWNYKNKVNWSRKKMHFVIVSINGKRKKSYFSIYPTHSVDCS